MKEIQRSARMAALFCSALFFQIADLDAAEVIELSWETAHASAPAKLSGGAKKLLPLIRIGVGALPEPAAMKLTFLGGSALGLPPKDAAVLHKGLSRRYRKISEDPDFKDMPSAIRYCYSAEKPNSGFATACVPDGADGATPTILFLHGYGGSFSYYLHFLATTFPDHIILCPAYGISCARVPGNYLDGCLRSAADRLDFAPQKPLLIGLSAGGFGGFREYASRPGKYSGFISIAAFPPRDMLLRAPRTGRIRLLAGGEETWVANGTLAKTEALLRRRTRDYASHLIPDEGHFFMLSAEAETKAKLRAWVQALHAAPR